MASKFVVREKSTKAFLTSTRRAHFSADLSVASLFASYENAVKASQGLVEFNDGPVRQQYGSWVVDNQHFHTNLDRHIEQFYDPKHSMSKVEQEAYFRNLYTERLCEVEVVEVNLTVVEPTNERTN